MIKEIRERESRVAEWPDRWIAVFLFTRKHDVERTLVFLKEHIVRHPPPLYRFCILTFP